MAKVYKYTIGEDVSVNENANTGMPSRVYQYGVVEEQLESANYDYLVRFHDGQTGKFKEKELNRVYVSEGLILKSGVIAENVEDDKESEQLLNIFFGHYKQSNNTYLIPKKLLINLINNVVKED